MIAKTGSSRRSNLRQRALSAALSMTWAVSPRTSSIRLSASSLCLLYKATGASFTAGSELVVWLWDMVDEAGSVTVIMELLVKVDKRYRNVRCCV